MLSRKNKEAFYRVFSPIMYINGVLYRNFLSPKPNNNKIIKVQLGPGQQNYFDGWVNVDANIFTGKADVWADIRYAIPFRDSSLDFIYSHHVIEHLPNLEFHFADLYRCLKPGGRIRIGGPNGDTAIQKFVANDKEWFIKIPDNRESIGGKFENFIFCRNEHLTILTFSYLNELLNKAGFKNIQKKIASKETQFPEVIDQNVLGKEWEIDPEFPLTLIIECEK